MPTSPSPSADYTKEVRFAVVMYGGVSLAIYINGVAQELHRMVRSTAENVTAPDGSQIPLSAAPNTPATQALKGTERVYRKLSHLLSNPALLEECRALAGQPADGATQSPLMQRLDREIEDDRPPVKIKFVVDILSGTSAGGINAIYLAKALANDQKIDQLKDLWVNEGDLALLLNDKQSVMGLHLRNQSRPQSLLNSRRMYFKLLKSLEDMEAQRPSHPSFNSPYVDELDLFITATDIEGVPVPLRLSNGVVFERRHRSVFHFRYGKAEVAGAEFNDFLHDFNPFLAFAARCTSSFPFAFEPMRLQDIEEVVALFDKYRSFNLSQKEKIWKRYFYEELDPLTGSPIEPPKFSRRSFGDGGYLDNKPFSYATETLAQRTSDVPVDRKLIYIEPSPEHPEDNPTTFEKINALQNVKAAILDLPTYETIREDLQRVLDRNQLIERVNRIVSYIEEDNNQFIRYAGGLLARDQYADANITGTGSTGPTTGSLTGTGSGTGPGTAGGPHVAPEWANYDLVDMADMKGRYYLPYRRLRIASVSDEIAKLFARLANFDEKSDQLLAIKALVRAWRMETFVDHYEEGVLNIPTTNKFLWSYDFGYRQRRLSFVRMKVDELSAFSAKFVNQLVSLKEGLDETLKAINKQLQETDLRNGVEGTLEVTPEQLGVTVMEDFAQIRLQQFGQRLLAFQEPPAELPAEQQKHFQEERRKEIQAIARFIKCELNEISKELRTWGRCLRARTPRRENKGISPDRKNFLPDETKTSPLLPLIQKLKLVPDDLNFILGMSKNGGKDGGQSLDEDDHVARVQMLLDQPGRGDLRRVLKKTARRLGRQLEVAFFHTRNQTNSLFSPSLPYTPISQRGSHMVAENPDLLKSEISEIVRGFLSYYYNQFDDYDQIRFPIMYETDYGEADVVEVIRISPEDATELIDERKEFLENKRPDKSRQKLAGVSLHHFGAFLDRTWRQNDIMWGRLDGAERLICGLLPSNLDEALRQELIKEAHRWIVQEDLKPENLKQFQEVIGDALMRASSGLSINDAINQVLQPLQQSAVKTKLEAIMLQSMSDDQLMKFMSDHYEVNRTLDPRPMLNSISRATQIIGKMFEDLADANGFEGKRLAWIARLGKVFWGLVEVAVPNSILNLMVVHWLKILYFFEVLLIVGSILLNSEATQSFGLKALGFTLALNIIVLLLRDMMRIRKRWQTALIAVLALVMVVLASIGFYELYELGFSNALGKLLQFGRSRWSKLFGQ